MSESVTKSATSIPEQAVPAADAALDQVGVAGSVPLATFLAGAGSLTLAQRRLVVDQAIVLIEQNYVHLPLKVAMHAVNPLQRLRLLRARMEQQTDGMMEAEWLFHRRMSSIFMSVRDLHTNYLLPSPFAGQVAYLPFLIEKARDAATDHYLVTQTVAGFGTGGFGRGVEVTHWNGVPIARAVELNGLLFAGSNEAANRARGLESLTVRPLVIQLPPDEDWVDVTYVGTDELSHDIRVVWQVAPNLPPMTDADAPSPASAAQGVDVDSDEKTRAKKLLFVPEVIDLEPSDGADQLDQPVAVGAADVATTMPSVFRARQVTTASGTYGHLRIFTFSVNDPVAFRDEFVRLASLLPQNGLIVDVRDNGGGHIYASEFTLQTMTPRHIQPEPVQFISTALNVQLCRRHKNNPVGIDLGPWFPSLERSAEIGATYSAAFPITPEDGANQIGQSYHGPIVLVTDARCYSATDIFAAGFADHGIGMILGVDDNTGAGGANVWTHGLLSQLEQLPAPDPATPYKPLPNGTNMRVAIRRSLRVGALSGTPVEDLGVEPNAVHPLTRDDVMNGNVDLLDAAGALLASMPVRQLDVTPSLTGSTLTVQLAVAGIDRVDVALDGRPATTADVAGATMTLAVTPASAGQRVEVRGFDAGELVASRLLTI